MLFQTPPRYRESDEDLRKKVTTHRSNGIPVVITHRKKKVFDLFESLLTTKRSDREEQDDGMGVDGEALCAGKMGAANVPVRIPIEEHPGYKCEEMPLKEFIENHWMKNDSERYLHQWPFTVSPVARERLMGICEKNLDMTDCLDPDLLSFWIDSKNTKNDTYNPMQYVFMGNKSSGTFFHRDNGGLAILIGCVLGEKEVVMMHRDDGHMGSATGLLPKNILDVSVEEYPMLAFHRLWKVTLRAGDVLIMPAGTYHFVRNPSACFSVHRLHLDRFNLPFFMQSMSIGEDCKVDHPEILWNATHGTMSRMEQDYDASGAYDPRLAEALKDLRACVQIVRSKCFKSFNDVDPQKYEWKLLLEDVDLSLEDMNVFTSSSSIADSKKRDDEQTKVPQTAFRIFQEKTERRIRKEAKTNKEETCDNIICDRVRKEWERKRRRKDGKEATIEARRQRLRYSTRRTGRGK